MDNAALHASIKLAQAALQRELKEIRRVKRQAMKEEGVRKELRRRLEIAEKMLSKITALTRRL